MEQSNRETSQRNRRIITFFRRYRFALVFVVLSLMVFFLYPSADTLSKGPYSEHMWRQSDGHAQVYALYRDSASFFQPRTLDYDMGIRAKGGQEFPLLYWVAASIDQVRGSYTPVTSNLLHFSVFWLGFFLLSFLLPTLFHQSIIQQVFAFLLLFLLWCSGLIQYYGLNQFPDIAALGFTFIGLFFFYWRPYQPLSFYLAAFFFVLAALSKVTFLIFPLSIYGAYLVKPTPLIRPTQVILSAAGIVLLSVSWIAYMKWYNAQWNTTGFLTSILPIWEMDKASIDWVWTRLKKEYFSTFLPWPGYQISFIILLLNLYALPTREKLIQIGITIGTIIYFMLFFQQFSVHSYYLIILVPLWALTGLFFIRYTLSQLPKLRFVHGVLFAILSLGILIQVKHAENYLEANSKASNRHHTYLSLNPAMLDESFTATWLDTYDIGRNELIITSPDPTTNVSLHNLRRWGWSVPKNEYSKEIIQLKIQQGAKYLVLWKQEMPELFPTATLIATDRGVRLYKLPTKHSPAPIQ